MGFPVEGPRDLPPGLQRSVSRRVDRSAYEPWRLYGACTYTGLCSFSINTAMMTDEQKSAFAQKCAARFPCSGRVDAGAQVPFSPGGNQPLPEGPVQGTRREQ